MFPACISSDLYPPLLQCPNRVSETNQKTSDDNTWTCSVRQPGYLVPDDVWIFARFHVVVDVSALNVFALAELSFLCSPHVGVVAQICVVFRHGQRHGHLHAVGWVPVGREGQCFISFLASFHTPLGTIPKVFWQNKWKHWHCRYAAS